MLKTETTLTSAVERHISQVTATQIYVVVFLCVSAARRNPQMAINGYLLGGLCGAGIAGNLLSVVVLQRDKDNKRNSTNWLLQAHAVFDSVYLLARLLARQFQYLACRQLDWLPAAVNGQFGAAAPYIASCASFAHMVSIWTWSDVVSIWKWYLDMVSISTW